MAGECPEDAVASTGQLPARAVLTALLELAGAVGIEVRIEPFDLKMAGKGGLCRIRKQRVILVDAGLGLLDQVGVIGEALGRVIPKENVPLRLLPYLRTGHGRVPNPSRLRPLARSRPKGRNR
ncbi:MAG: hypothetical protein K0S65_2940 [Labilithrix sp.]|nr:hypothetical protein [Labilithrix sp.]